jgi:hypothetical protein
MAQESKRVSLATIDRDELAELDRRWAAIEAGEADCAE